ncbi:hydrolase [Enterococcus faecium]|uniref:Hydrolase n=1 Tax=Enterococcus faecium TaxID=1352 RepID=A0AB74CUH2_ENTFC|nr:hydrolase [Enterococcus faecium]ROX46876.1 hydrolase [Enterococcus faecium]ROX55721.1 hydrolase [Enterococcus faecium]ROX63293.1 hydrolase [Enterococcus faecium]
MIYGVQKLASAVISPIKRKIGGAIFVWLFLLLDAGQLFHNLLPDSHSFFWR